MWYAIALFAKYIQTHEIEPPKLDRSFIELAYASRESIFTVILKKIYFKMS